MKNWSFSSDQCKGWSVQLLKRFKQSFAYELAYMHTYVGRALQILEQSFALRTLNYFYNIFAKKMADFWLKLKDFRQAEG
jgi:hypothetical protein